MQNWHGDGPNDDAGCGTRTVGTSISAIAPDRRPIHASEALCMCRNIRTLFNFEPPVTEDEIRAASLQFVRKVTGFNKPSKVNAPAFDAAVDAIAAASARLLGALATNAPPRYREIEADKARARAAERFAR
jgi:hypothetical protein